MTQPRLHAFMAAASACAHAMMDNAVYMERELPTLGLSADLSSRISALCATLIGTKHDIVTEVIELDELCCGAEPADPAAVAHRVERTVRWLGEEMPKLHEVVVALQSAMDSHAPAGTAYLLVAGSAVNVYDSYEGVRQAADEYDRQAGHDHATTATACSPTLAHATFACSVCGAEAGRISLDGGASSAEIKRTSFTSELRGAVPSAQLDALRAAVESSDARRLHALDLEYAPFYCPKCDAVYCREHWVKWDVFDDDGWHDSIRGRCPSGHERMLED